MRFRPMLLAVLGLWLAGAERANVCAEWPERSERIVSYTIRAHLDPAAKTVRGDMDLVWRNPTDEPVDELYFHLYLNAFASEDSTFHRERARGDAGGTGRPWTAEHAGSVEVVSMRREDGAELWTGEHRSFVAPDDGNEQDRTLARVALPAPVAPGDSLSLRVRFRSRLPRVRSRTGWSGDPDDPDDLFFMVAQWFPKIAVLSRGKNGAPRWNAHQFHRNTEFFADYGTYLVSITVPETYVVGATGRATAAPTRAGRGEATFVFRQEDVHDFAWTASPHFVEKEYEWDAAGFLEQAPPAMAKRLRALEERTARHVGRPVDEIRPSGSIAVRLLLQPDHAGLADRFYRALGASLFCYGTWFGDYPYETLTLVDAPAGGPGAGGMEYPTLITVWGDRLAPDFATGMEGVTIHEFGHQYFYGLVGTNEFEEAWLDEGLTSYTDARVFEEAYGPRSTRTRYRPFHTPFFRPFAAPRIFERLSATLALESWLGCVPVPWREPDSLAAVPGRNPLFDYLREMPFAHLPARVPVPAPLSERNWWLGVGSHDAMAMPGWHFASRKDYAVNAYGKPTVFFHCLRGLMGEATFDRALREYATKHRFGHPTTADLVALLAGHAPHAEAFLGAMTDRAARLDAAILSAGQRQRDDGRWVWTVRVQRRGGLPVPLEVRVDGGTPWRWEAGGRATTRTFRAVRDRPMEVVRLGPDWLRNVDGRLANNARVVGGPPDRRAALALAARWSLFAEEIVRTHAGLGR